MEESTEATIEDNNSIISFIKDTNMLFCDNSRSIDLLKAVGRIKTTLHCPNCRSDSMLHENDRSQTNGFVYRCRNSSCRHKQTAYATFNHKLPKIPFSKILQCLYYFCLKLSNYSVIILTNISETTYINLKKIFVKAMALSSVPSTKLGGEGQVIQVDETACNRRRLITSPTSENEYIRGTKWVIGAICETTKEIRLSVLDNRSHANIKQFLESNVMPGTIIKTDGYPSYPRAIREIGCIHLLVNHTEGFVSNDGVHTNLIENVWAHLKTDLRSKRGIMFKNLSHFILEWSMHYNMVKKKKKADIDDIFLKLIKFI